MSLLACAHVGVLLACAHVGSVSTHTVQDALLGNGTARSGLSLPVSDNTGRPTGQPNVDSRSWRLSSQVLRDCVEWTTEAHQEPFPFHTPRDTHAPSSTVNTGDIGHCFHLRRSQRDGPSAQAVRSQNLFHPLVEEYTIKRHSSGVQDRDH